MQESLLYFSEMLKDSGGDGCSSGTGSSCPYIDLSRVQKRIKYFMNYTYMVQCADGTLYTGWTNCLQKRLRAHNEGKTGAKYTRAKRPVSLVYYEGYGTKEEAMSREYAIKQLTRKEKLKLMEF